ncbi:MAG: PAS domain S-box protein [Thermodesulfobacteriota bacterium]
MRESGPGSAREVSALVEDFRALKESEVKYRTLVNNSLTGIIIITQDEIRFANRTFEQLTGYTQEDIRHMAPWDMVHESERERVRQMGLQRLRRSNVKDYYETRWVRKDGEVIWVEVRAAAAEDRGDPAVLANVVDITARKLAQQNLQRRIEMEKTITAISTRFINLSAEEITPGINDALGQIGEFSGADHGFILDFGPRGEFVPANAWSRKGQTEVQSLLQDIRAGDCSWLLAGLRSFQVIYIPQPQDLPEEAAAERSVFEAHGVGAFIAVPMNHGGRLLGFLGFDTRGRTRIWKEEDLTAFRMAAQVFVNVLERQRMEQVLYAREEELAFQTRNLEEANVALKVLLKRREEDQKELAEKILANVNDLILPFLEQLEQTGLDTKQAALLHVVESNLLEITTPFSHTLSTQFGRLTPTEIKIANMIKTGLTSKDIAALMRVTSAAVDFHRYNIRRKLGLNKTGSNLRTYLLGLK